MVTVKQIELNENEAEQVLDLLQTGFSEQFSLDWLVWKYIKNPLLKGNRTLVYAAIDEELNKIIGLSSFVPYDIKINDKIINSVQVCDVVVHPSYRNSGIFTLRTEKSKVQARIRSRLVSR